MLGLIVAALILTAAPQDTAHAALTIFRDCPDCPQMVVVPAGETLLGSGLEETGRAEIEGPARRVPVRSFAAAVSPITRGEWSRFVQDTGRMVSGGCAWASATGHRPDPDANWANLNFSQDDKHPVVCVSWTDAQDYLAWLSRKSGRSYRLLTEVEWEYAARAGSTGPYPWGERAERNLANYGADVCCSGFAQGDDLWVGTAPVDASPANAFGLLDMHGNALEWVQDCFHLYADNPGDGSAYEQAVTLQRGPGVTPTMIGQQACDYRMLRGGDWGNPPRMIRSASRNYAPPPGSSLESYSSGGLGFRVAASLE